MLYVAVLVLTLFLSSRYDFHARQRGKLGWYIILLIIFILIAGLRYRIGVDTVRYDSQYRELPTLSEFFTYNLSKTRFDPGYVFFNAIARSISDSFVAMQFLQAIYVNCIMFWFLKKYSSKIFLAIFFYAIILYLNFMCEVMRESCAVVTFLLGFPYFVQGKWLKYYICAIISVLFHSSALITLVLPVLYIPIIRHIFSIGKRTPVILLFTFFVGVAVSTTLFRFIGENIEIGSIQEKALSYGKNDLSGMVLNIFGILSVILRQVALPLLSIMIVHNRNEFFKIRNKDYQPISFMVVFCLLFAVLSIPIALCYRYNNYFAPFAIIVMANAAYSKIYVNHRKIKLDNSFWSITLGCFIFLQLYGLIAPKKNQGGIADINRYYPYSSVFTEEKDPDREELFRHYHAY